MDEMPSAEFRRQYAKLTRPTVVTVNGHPIGTWTPRGWRLRDTASRPGRQVGKQFAEGVSTGAATVQAARDDLLRKINRGK